MEAASGIHNLGDQMMEGGEMALLAATFSDSSIFCSTIKNRKVMPKNVCLFFRERDVVHSQKCFFSSFKEEKAFASGDKILQTRGSKSLFCVPQCHTVELKNCLSQLALHGMTRRGSEWPERAS